MPTFPPSLPLAARFRPFAPLELVLSSGPGNAIQSERLRGQTLELHLRAPRAPPPRVRDRLSATRTVETGARRAEPGGVKHRRGAGHGRLGPKVQGGWNITPITWLSKGNLAFTLAAKLNEKGSASTLPASQRSWTHVPWCHSMPSRPTCFFCHQKD